MDLAKIRKKARFAHYSTTVADRADTVMPESGQTAQRRDELRPFGSSTRPDGSEHLLQAFQPHPQRRETGRSPLEIILAGRQEAGCTEELLDAPQDHSPAQAADFEEFLCVRVSDETYGITIMQIKEIITPRQVTEIPRAPSYVCGVISLRGIVIPVFDMTERLGLSRTATTGKERIVVVKSGSGDSFTGLLVDQVSHVARFASPGIEAAPVTLNGIDRDFVRGIGHTDSRLVILLNIESLVDIQLT